MYRFLLTVAIVAPLAALGGVWLDGRLRESRRQSRVEFELRVERELDKPISLAGIAGGDQTLSSVLRHITRQVDVPMVCNRAKLEEVLYHKKQIDLPDAKLTLRSVLGILYHQLSIGYYSDGGRLVITSMSDAEGRVTTRVYPLPQLAGPEQPFGADVDTWIEVLSVVIEPDSWDGRGGPAQIVPVPGALIIRQTRRAHDRLQRFFRRLENDSPSPDAQTDYLSSFSVEERRIHAALEISCDFHCTAAPLNEVMDKLSREHRIPIVLRPRQLGEAAIELETPLTLKMQGASLRAVLRSLLEQAGLTYVIGDDVLQVTTPEDAAAELRAVVYDVRDLVGKGVPDFDSLEELISTTVEPDSWDEMRGSGPFQKIHPGWLTFREADHIHEGTANLLTKLRAALRRRMGDEPRVATRSPAEQKIPAALERTVQLEYRELPLGEVIADLVKKTGMNLRMDERKLEEADADSKVPVTCGLPAMPLKMALNSLARCQSLAEFELAWCVRDESLVLTTNVEANSAHELLVLDIRDLVEPREDENSFDEEILQKLIETIIQKPAWRGTAYVSTFQSLLVCSAPKSANEDVQRLVKGLRSFREESLLARKNRALQSPLLVRPREPTVRNSLVITIYPVDDLLGPGGAYELDDLKAAILEMLAAEKWREDAGADTIWFGEVIPVPPAGLLLAQTQVAHDKLQGFLDELRQHLVPGRPLPPWLISRDKRRQELEQALSSRESVLNNVTRMKELRTAVERAIKQDVALGLLYLVRQFQKTPGFSTAWRPGSSPPTVKEQLAGLGLAVVDTERGLKLLEIFDDERLAFIDARKLLSGTNPFTEEELCTLLASSSDRDGSEQMPAGVPACFRGWIVVRSYEQRLAQLVEMVGWLEQHPEAPRALEVRERRSPRETERLIRQFLNSGSAAEQLYLAFVLQFAAAPEDGMEELAGQVEALAGPTNLLLAIRLKESLNRWVSVLSNERVETIFNASRSRFLRMAAMQTLASRLSLRDPIGEILEIRTEKMIAARAELPPEEVTELREALTMRHSPAIHRTDFEEKDRSDAPLLRDSAPRLPPWRKSREWSRRSSARDPFE